MNNEQMEEIKRHFGVVAEGLGHKIQRVAEGVSNIKETFDRDMTSLREDNEQAHREILSAIKFSYAELDHYLKSIQEARADEQAGRVKTHAEVFGGK